VRLTHTLAAVVCLPLLAPGQTVSAASRLLDLNSFWNHALVASLVGRLQYQPCTPILQVNDYKRVGSANGDRTRICHLYLFPRSY